VFIGIDRGRHCLPGRRDPVTSAKNPNGTRSNDIV